MLVHTHYPLIIYLQQKFMKVNTYLKTLSFTRVMRLRQRAKQWILLFSLLRECFSWHSCLHTPTHTCILRIFGQPLNTHIYIHFFINRIFLSKLNLTLCRLWSYFFFIFCEVILFFLTEKSQQENEGLHIQTHPKLKSCLHPKCHVLFQSDGKTVVKKCPSTLLITKKPLH